MKLCLFICTLFSSYIFSNQNLQFSGNLFLIGDSHVEEFIGLSPDIPTLTMMPNAAGKTDHPTTMYIVGRDRGQGIITEPTFSLLKDGDAAVFSFGQIDANWLIWKQVNVKHRHIDEVVETLVNNYLDVISTITDKHILKIVYNVTPPSNNAYAPPYVGSLDERILYTRKLNAVLAQKCIEKNIVFLNIYDDYSDAQGMLRLELSDGNHHINRAHNGILLQKLCAILTEYR